MIRSVIFDLDGLLVDSEPVWFRARTDLVRAHGFTWSDADQRAMAGVHTDVWVHALCNRLEGQLSPAEVQEEIVARMEAYYLAGNVARLPGADEALRACRSFGGVGLASGSPRRLISAALSGLGWSDAFDETLSSDEVGPGKPAPDVYLRILERLAVQPRESVVVEDSGAGIRSGLAAGAFVVAVPNPHSNPGSEALATAHACIPTLHGLTDAIRLLAETPIT